ncbi:hypothetical protein SAMN02745131_01998 [Flavisolibacter ginsengisoli DSM 18119]|jgi:hypothetical protein|uniref:Uncharacterized protein n=1 Tax=Flavisolibacter ginsengisoli DSM 18119 TaxID=1121884 RepID=A0A1M4ZM60_9BACT|nr:hypothetical protein SAMN02745131_01998 [Flavisolibacter ginsengisoli DSM 18119]
MTKFHPFFVIGTVGMILTAILHMFLSLMLTLTTVHATFYVMYPIFLTFLILGVVFTVKKQKASLTN